MRPPARRPDDADVIRARLRALLQEAPPRGGWLPDDDPPDDELPDDDLPGVHPPDVDPLRADRLADDPPARDPGGAPVGGGRHRAPGTAVRWDPGPAGSRALWLAGLLAVALLLGWTWLDRPPVQPAPPPPVGTEPAGAPPTGTVPTGTAPTGAPPGGAAGPAGPSVAAGTSPTVVVAVVGEVARPGLVTLPAGARVADAVDAAGGLLPDADPASVNLAAPLADGQQVAVGVPGAPAPAAAPAGGPPGPAPGGRVDLNTAGAAELDALPGIGPVLAARIVEHRARAGPFRSVDQLDDVPGIGPAVFAGLVDAVTV